MRPAGAAMIAAAKADGSWTSSTRSKTSSCRTTSTPPSTVIPARQEWDGFPPSARKAILTWIVTANVETRRPRGSRRRRRAARWRAGALDAKKGGAAAPPFSTM